MAAGRYRSNYRKHEYRSRELDLEISMKSGRYEKIEQIRAKYREEDSREGVLVNGFAKSKKFVEREPGELSSDDETVPFHDSTLITGKRKFPMDVFEGEENNNSKTRNEMDKESISFVETEENMEFVPARHILSSRWANENDNDEENRTVKEVVSKKKKTSPLGLNSEKTLSKSCSSSSNASDNTDNSDENGTSTKTDSDSEKNANDITELDSERSINMLQGCRNVNEFERLNRIDEGTYGVVFRARDKKSGEVVALKKVKLEKEREGFPLTALREINILLSFNHPSIVDVKEVVMGDMNSVFMVMEYMEHDLKGLVESMKHPFSQSEVKCLMQQLLSGVRYLHDNWVLHRDLKTSNILINNCGGLKICDFGMARQYGSPLKAYTQLVVTLWYRAPELLLGAKKYSTAIDMWSLGCIMAELLTKEPLFPGKSEIDQLNKIFKILGTPNKSIWPGFVDLPGSKAKFAEQPCNKLGEKFRRTAAYTPFTPMAVTARPVLSESGLDLLNRLLTFDPEKRITAQEALDHDWFREVPLPKSKELMPTYPAQHAQDRRLRRVIKSPDPLEELRIKELQSGVGTGGLFG